MQYRSALPALLLCAGASLAFAQPPRAGAAETPVFGSEVSVVSVPVFVVGRDGHAMRGLRPEDFELYDDKHRVPIVSFQYIDTTSPEAQEAIREAPAARRRFLLLFDLSFTDPGGIIRAREAAHRFVLRELAASDLAAVATFDVNRGLRLIANFTEDKATLVKAVETLGVPSLVRLNDPLSLSVQMTDVNLSGRERDETTNAAVSDSILAVLARRLRSMDEVIYRDQVTQLLRSLGNLARGLRGVEGRKQVLYFSAGFDSQVLVGNTGNQMRTASESIVNGDLFEVDSEARYGDTRLRDIFGRITRELSNADCVVHSIDVTGLGRDDSLVQTEVTRDPGRFDDGSTKGRESLNYVSAETGGRFFKDTNNLGTALDEVLAMTSRYYILGYQPDDLEGPGRFHKLKVKVRRKGARVSNRAGYYEREPRPSQTHLQQQFESAQLVMTGVGPHDLHFSALCLPFPSPGDRQTLGVVLQVPRAEIASKEPVPLEVYGYAVAEDGTVMDHLAQLARVDLDRADPQGRAEGLSFYGTLEVPPGRYTVRLMLQRPDTGAAGVQFIDVSVPPYDPRAGFLLPPVLMEDASRWVRLELGAAKRTPRDPFPFTLDGEPFLPRTDFRLKGRAPEKLVLIAYEPDRPQDPAAGIEIHSSVTDASGATVPAGSLRIDHVFRDAGGRRTYVLAYTPDSMAPGDYTLRIGIGEAGTRLESYALLRVGARRN
jgi:VWFA-related protein